MKELQFYIQRFAYYGTSGNDQYTNNSSNTYVYGGGGNDYFWNYGSYVSVDAGIGEDTIDNRGNYSTVIAGDGNDYIHSDPYHSSTSTNNGINSKLYGGNGNDTIQNFANGVSMYGGNDNDSLYNYRYGVAGTTTIYGGERVLMDGGEGNDYIYSGGRSTGGGTVTVMGGTGNDTIEFASNSRNNTIIYYYGDGSDIVKNYNSTDTIDLRYNYYTRETLGSNVILNIEGSGKISLVGAKSQTINIINGTVGGVGKYIDNPNSSTVITGTAYNDTIYNSGSSGGDYSTINANAGNDSIYSYDADYVTVYAGDGNDSVTGAYYSAKIYGGYGSDLLSIRGSYFSNTIDGGEDNDTIYAYGGSINGGAGADLISLMSGNSGSTVTLRGGAGNDIFYTSNVTVGNLYQYSYGDGYDTIYGFKSTDTLSISTSYTTMQSGNDLVYNMSGGSITLKNYKPSPTPTAIYNYTKNSLVSGQSVADSIYNYAGGVTIRGNDGNDYIYTNTDKNYTINGGYGYVTIDGGEGNDTIHSYDSRVSISGGAGSDLISIRPWTGTSKVSINAGTGNDIIYGDSLGGGILYQYKSGDGSDIIYGYKGTDSITISGASHTTKISGDNVLINISSGGTITLVGAKNETLNIYSDSPEPLPTPTPTMTAQEVIKKFMKSMDDSKISSSTVKSGNSTITAGEKLLNDAIAAVSDYTSIRDVIDKMVKDCEKYTSAGGAGWESFLIEKCGINLNNNDTGAITGKDAGTSTKEKNASDIVEETGVVDRNFTDTSFSINGLNVYLNQSFSSLGEKEQYIWQALRSWWLKGSLNLIAESYGDNFSFNSNSSSTITNNKLFVEFYRKDNSGTQAGVAPGSRNSYGEYTGPLTLSINMYLYDSVQESSKDGENKWTPLTYNSNYGYAPTKLDRTLAHEFTHAVMDANIRYATGDNGLPQFIKDGMSDLTHGVDDERKDEIIELAKDPAALKDALRLDKLYQHYPAYAGGYMFLRYIAKQFSTSSSSDLSNGKVTKVITIPTGVTINNGILTAGATFKGKAIDMGDYTDSDVTKVNATNVTSAINIYGTTSDDSILGSKSADSIYAASGNDTLFGGAGNDFLSGGSGNDKISGDAGNDSLYGGIGNDTLTGGVGKDLFVYGGGKDIITDYQAEDEIKIESGSITKSTISGNDIIFTTEDGSVTVKDGKDKKITVIDVDENRKVYDLTPTPSTAGVTVSGANLTVDTKYTGNTIKLADYSGVTKANASKVTKALTITGTSSANSIVGGSGADVINGDSGNDTILGGKGNDTLYGGEGNDTLTGGAGYDVFVYENGNDTVTDYVVGQDKIKFEVAITSHTVSNKDVIFKTSQGDLTVKNGKGKKITVVDSNGNSTTQIYNGSTPSTAGVTVSGANLTVDTKYTGNTIKLADYSGVTKANASKVTKALTITGTSSANSIVGGSGADVINGDSGNDTILGGKGNDTLYGGEGNDTLTGGAGYDVFVYENGNDTVTDYVVGQDKIKFEVAITSHTVSNKDVIFKTSQGDLTVKNGKGKKITVVDSNGNSTTQAYTSSSSSYANVYDEDIWFMDDNFVSDENRIDSISEVTADNYSVGKIDTLDYNSLDYLQIASSSQHSLNNK